MRAINAGRTVRAMGYGSKSNEHMAMNKCISENKR